MFKWKKNKRVFILIRHQRPKPQKITSLTDDANKFLEREIGHLSWKWCEKCEQNQPPRAHHCKVCDVCVLKRDHHCFFTGKCEV